MKPWSILAILFLCAPGAEAEEAPRRPLLVTVDDLPIAGAGGDAAERSRITDALLGHLAAHHIRAVGLVTWANVGDDGRELLERWIAAGHELGNHSDTHPSYSRTPFPEYRDDMERCRRELVRLLGPHGQSPRFFRYPYLREGDTREKVDAMRAYLDESGQRVLTVTLDNQDWSYDAPFRKAVAAGDEDAVARVASDYHAALRFSIRHHERRGDRLLGHQTPQILLLHANAVGASEWGRLFDWLEETGHRFVTADEILQEPILADPPAVVAPFGYGAWDRLWQERNETAAREAVEGILASQADAWNAGDLVTFASVYARDAVYVSSAGITKGHEAILARYEERFPDRASMGTLGFEIVEVRPASGVEVSLLGDAKPGGVHGVSAVARWHLTYLDREPASGLTLIVLRREAGEWKMVQDASL